MRHAGLKEKSVLYVEDDLETRDQMVFLLEKMVGRLYIASNGREGLELFRQYDPDLVITDIQMPVMNGLDLLAAVKKHRNELPVVVTTAFNETNYLLSAINLGVDRYLLKPINLKELRETVTELLEKPRNILPRQSLDERGMIIDVNRSWLDFLGYEREEVIGRYIGNFIAEDFHHIIREKFKILKREGVIENVYYQFLRKDGSRVDVALHGKSYYRADGSFEATRCELRDIGSLMNAEEKTLFLLRQERYLKGLILTHATIGRSISNVASIQEFLQEICKAFVDSSAFEYAFAARDEQGKQLRIVAQSMHEFLDVTSFAGETIAITENRSCIACQALLSQNIVILDDLGRMEASKMCESLMSRGIRAMVALPFGTNIKEEYGGVFVMMLRETHHFENEELELFTHIADTVSFGIQAISDRIEKERLIKELDFFATTDLLTGCMNRRKGVEILAREEKRARRYRRYLAVMFFDIDHFKQINDRFGHRKGDDMLKEIAEKVQRNIRTADTIVRWGGEEFVVILPETDIGRGVKIAEKIQHEIGTLRIEPDFRISASFGVSELREGESWEQLVSRADALMYEAKQEGRNRVRHG